MLNIKNILTPVDFSERADLAVEHSVALARRFGSTLILLHAVPPSPYEYAAFDEGFYAASNWPDREAVAAAVEKRLDELAKRLTGDVVVRKLVLHGDPAAVIEDAAREYKVDLVVMPTHGYGSFRRLLLGSVTSKVLHDLDVPVFTGAHVPELTPINPEPYKRIACAIDLDSHPEEVLRWGWGLAQACAEDLLVIYAAPEVVVGGTYGDWFPPETREQIVEKARGEVAKLLEKVGCTDKAQVVVDAANPVRLIRQATDENYADLLVIGRTSQEGVLKGLRADAQAIIRDAPCPVISV